MKHKSTYAILVLALAAITGVWSAVSSWGGVIYVSNEKYLQSERFPAAIRRVFDYSQFQGKPLKIRSVKRMISDAEIIEKAGNVGVELGHFVTRGDDGKGEFACEFYDRVVLKFEGQGIMEFGNKPIMTVEAPCLIAGDINRIETIWIPAARLMNENKEPARFIEVSYPEQTGVRFKFDDMTSEWPKEWTLVSVRLYSEANANREVSVSRSEITDILEKNFTIRF